MEKTEYTIQLKQIFNLAYLVQQLKIAGVLGAMNHAEAFGPILDPTTYLKAATGLEWQKKIVEAALQFQHAVEEIVSDPRYSHSPAKGKTQ